MRQLIYTSIAAPEIDGGEVFKIISSATTRNHKRNITGILSLVKGRFFQAIEGPEDEVETLFSVLALDSRHHSLKVLKRNTITDRQFPNWGMKRLLVGDVRMARNEFARLVDRHRDAKTILAEFEGFLQRAH